MPVSSSLRRRTFADPQVPPIQAGANRQLVARLWHWLHGPWLPLVAGLLGSLVILAAWMLPQLPGQLQDEPATAGRWLATTSANYGVWGSTFQALGLFNILHSPLLATLLILLVVTASVHLARTLARLRQYARLPQLLNHPARGAGEPVDIEPVEPVARRRDVLPSPPDQVAALAHTHLRTRFAAVQHSQVAVHAPDSEQQVLVPDDRFVEHRLLARKTSWTNYLVPLFPLGLLLAITAIWLTTAFGWQISTPLLAPGESFRSVNQGLTIHYRLSNPETDEPITEITLDGASRQVPSSEGSTRFGLAGAAITLRSTVPALWVQSLDAATVLAQPNASEPVGELGLVFATPGSEESILLPNESAGLRLVRRTDLPDAFMVELYRSTDVQPSLRAEVRMPESLTVPLEDGRKLRVTPTRALQAEVRYLPGLWLAWAGLALLLAGVVGAVRRPSYLLVQIAPWPPSRSLLVAQASRGSDLDWLLPLLASDQPLPDDLTPLSALTPAP